MVAEIMSKAPYLSFETIGGESWRILRFADESDKRWSAFNPSISYSPVHGYTVLFRSSNYFFDPETSSTVISVGNRVQSRMWLGSLTKDWTLDIDSLVEVDFSEAGMVFKRGAEDGRLYWRDGAWEITAGLQEPGIDLPRIGRFRLEGLKAKLIEIYDDGVLFDVEKNWMSTDNPTPEFDFIYTPVKVYKRGVGPLKLREISEGIRNVRGGSQLRELEDGRYLAIVHEADMKKVRVHIPRMFVTKDVSIRTYVHRFATYDKTGKLVGLGPRFKLSDARIEFAAGMVLAGEDVIVSYGYKAVASYLGRLSLQKVLDGIEDV
jgi:hypothetical protein